MAKTKLPVIFEPSGRHVRVKFNGEFVADSKQVMLLRDKGFSIHYLFPEADVKMEYLVASDHVEHSGYKGDKTHWTVQVGDKIAENGAWAYPVTKEGRPDMTGYIGFVWDAMDVWLEEDEEALLHPRDPYHRVDYIRSSRHIRVEANGHVIAETTNPLLVFETGLPTRYYIPTEDIKMEYLTPTDHHSICPYKGQASYWTITAGGQEFANMVWAYPLPIPEAPKLKDMIAFYNEKLDIFIDGELENKPRTVFA